MSVTDGVVLRPVSSLGLNPKEITVAEILQKQGYATACIGKWHLGDQGPFLPTRQGFDYYFGIPYSDDMTARKGKPWPPLPLMKNEKVIEAPVDRALLTKRYTEECVRFMKQNREKPFFLYLAHAMPGSTRKPFASDTFRGKSKNGAWGDSVEEIDWSTGQLLKALKDLKIDSNTLVIWTSDNGAPRRRPPQGLNLPLSGWGYTTAEGGMRVPCLVRWPGRIRTGVVNREIRTTMDFLPTFAKLAGARPPQDRVIDGKVWPLATGEEPSKPLYDAFYYFHMNELQAVRSGPWKLYLKTKKREKAALFNLRDDLTEKKNVIAEKQQLARKIAEIAKKMKRRPVGKVKQPRPQSLSRH